VVQNLIDPNLLISSQNLSSKIRLQPFQIFYLIMVQQDAAFEKESSYLVEHQPKKKTIKGIFETNDVFRKPK
jgi:hypothetical protein